MAEVIVAMNTSQIGNLFHSKNRNIATRSASVNHAVMVMTSPETYLKNVIRTTGSFDSFSVDLWLLLPV
jgi:hypothetical protein